VVSGKTTYGLLPIENTREGTVTAAQDLLVDTDLKICAETVLKVDHHLLGQGTLPEIQKIYSHPQALAQCDEWLSKHAPNAERIPASSTAAAVEHAVTEPGSAAIGSLLAGEKFGLPILAECIQDQADNQTRFLVLSTQCAAASGQDKTSMIFGLRHEVGALNHVLTLLEKHGINLLRIESRPHQARRWEYLFFLDVEGHIGSDELQQTVTAMEAHCTFIKVLGSYPRAQEQS
jgi:chorismate mutase/prephenate dehydratase